MGDDWKAEDYFLQFEDSYYEGPLVDAPLVHKAHRVGTYYRAWVMYRHHLIMGPNNEEAVERFHARFNRLAGVGALMERMPD